MVRERETVYDRGEEMRVRGACETRLALLLMTGAALLCQGQAGVEYGAATAAKGAAGPAAKKLGDGLGSILKRAGSALDASQKGAVQGDSGRAVRPSSAGVAVPPAAKSKPVNEKEPTAEEFEKITVGMTSDELLAVLGKPAFRVVLPEDGRLVEICEYTARGRQLGSIRVVDGKVAEVQRASQ